ncbi:MAG: DUF5320 domain-containing protein [Candidatus Aminicenantes bacterium]|nr:DUF5320 domain-containing protein [Candidatus Aminicenantes bacterium]
MPGFDGTGPRGKGPMSGKGGGFCLLNIPDSDAEPQRGFTGLAGKPVSLTYGSFQQERAQLRERLLVIEAELQELKERLANLEAEGGK